MEIRRLERSDDRSAFTSGDLHLDRFLREFAGQNQFRHHLGVTYIAVEGGEIAGYVTVARGELDAGSLSAAGPGSPAFPVPVLRLARLAVAVEYQGQGLGTRLTGFALHLALALADDWGCYGVVVDAKPHTRAFYERLGFLALDAIEGASDARPAPIPMYLPLAEIRRARGD